MNDRLPDLLARRAALDPAAPAIEDVRRGETVTFTELDLRASGAAALLTARGVGEGDRVAILCRNRIEFFELLFACARIGALLVPLNWRMPAAELDGLVADAEPSLLLHGEEDADAVGRLAARPPSLALDADYARERDSARSVRARGNWASDSPWYLLYTSGTTGGPKAVIYTFRMALANFVSIGAAIGLRRGDRVPCFLPLFHTAGINLHALPTLFAGGTILVLRGFEVDPLIDLIDAGRLDHFFAVPAVYQQLLANPRFAAARRDAVRSWGCGGAPLPDSLARACLDLGMAVCNGMGMTETGPTALLADEADARERIGSVGSPQLLCQARIADHEGRELPDGEVGEVQFAGPGVTPGYWRNEEATRAAFTADGWLRSGDLGRREPDGHFYIVGRAKEMFISGGENVYPAEVENVLCGHPDVLDAAVVSRADHQWGEVGIAFVQLGPGAAVERLAPYCRERLAAYKVPGAFYAVEEFPRTSAGKIRKHLLIETALCADAVLRSA